MGRLTFMTTLLLRRPVCHPGDLEGVRPWPRPVPVDRGPDGVVDRALVDDPGKDCLYRH